MTATTGSHFWIRLKWKISESSRQIRTNMEIQINLNRAATYNTTSIEITKQTAQQTGYEST